MNPIRPETIVGSSSPSLLPTKQTNTISLIALKAIQTLIACTKCCASIVAGVVVASVTLLPLYLFERMSYNQEAAYTLFQFRTLDLLTPEIKKLIIDISRTQYSVFLQREACSFHFGLYSLEEAKILTTENVKTVLKAVLKGDCGRNASDLLVLLHQKDCLTNENRKLIEDASLTYSPGTSTVRRLLREVEFLKRNNLLNKENVSIVLKNGAYDGVTADLLFFLNHRNLLTPENREALFGYGVNAKFQALKFLETHHKINAENVSDVFNAGNPAFRAGQLCSS